MDDRISEKIENRVIKITRVTRFLSSNRFDDKPLNSVSGLHLPFQYKKLVNTFYALLQCPTTPREIQAAHILVF